MTHYKAAPHTQTEAETAWPMIFFTGDDDATYLAQMGALVESRILEYFADLGKAATLNGLSRAALRAFADEVASYFYEDDLIDPPAAILDELELRAAKSPRPDAPADEIPLQQAALEILERNLRRARRLGRTCEAASLLEAVRMTRRRLTELQRAT